MSNDVVPISIVRDIYTILSCISHLWQAFLLVLFLVQPLGTSRLSTAFAPSGHLRFFLLHLIPYTNFVSHLYLAAPPRNNRHLQHHKVSWHFSRFRSFAGRHVYVWNLWAFHTRLIDLFPDFVRTKNYDTLSGVLLAVTGCEALFAK